MGGGGTFVFIHGVGAVGIREYEHRVRTESTREVLDILLHVLGCGKVDKVLRARLQDEILLAARVNANDSQTDAAGGNLRGQVTEPWRKCDQKHFKAMQAVSLLFWNCMCLPPPAPKSTTQSPLLVFDLRNAL